ncbi:unnamed protein product [Rotaria sp. Silwood1]|nr:unnamed protein product [Rotaria sp. Silwood1]CAF1403503.1 unnamed protein product [Rotaria sp. Silwood1]CAF1404470.1 unnamed protein product [Rotaria sp. Silwood1]
MLFRKDPCGIVCIALTYAMLLHCLYVILFVIIIPLLNESLYGTLHALITCTFIFLCMFSHARASYFDPGFVPLPKKGIDFSDVKINDNNKVNEHGWTICNRCDTYRPARSHHCRVHSIIICVESCLFGLFVVTIFVDQVQSILNDRSLIDTLKLDEDSRMTQQILPPARVLLRKVFGPGPMILWLLPCDLKKSNETTDLQNMHHV